MSISTIITNKFFDLKMVDLAETGHFWEFKEFKNFWIKQLDCLSQGQPIEEDIVFLVGATPHRFKVTAIHTTLRKFIPETYKSAIETETAYALRCVPTIEDVARYNGIQVWKPEGK